MDRRVGIAGVLAVSVAAGGAGWWYAVRSRDLTVAIDTVVVSEERVLTVTSLAGPAPCYTGARVDVAETAERVVLTFRLRRDGSATCPSIAERYTKRVTLRDPLGDRPVVDGHHDRGVVVSGRR